MLITTDRLRLREFVEPDWPAVLAYQSHPDYLRYYPWRRRTEEDVQAFVQQFIDWQQAQPRKKFQVAIEILAEERLIGNCGLRMERPKALEAELGYEIDPRYWGRGYATEAARAMLAYGFKELGLHRIWAACLLENRASARVLAKLGMRCEGQLRENRWFKARWWDTLLYSILEYEWLDGQSD
jgi:RimJ/RimL family protein N-acetyltransferase